MARATLPTVLRLGGTTYCEQAGITLRDKPAPLYQLLVLCTLLAKPISADLAVEAARELRRSGLRTVARTAGSTWQQRVDALGRGHYRRYDESTATILAESAQYLADQYRGDLRRLAARADNDREQATKLLTEVPGIGPTGASAFLREVQRVWSWVAPYVDERMQDGARKLGLPASRAGLGRLLTENDPAALGAALVRVTLDDELLARIRSAG